MKIWRDALDLSSTGVSPIFMRSLKAKLDHAEYTPLHDMADPLIASASLHDAAGKPNDYSKVNIR